MLLRKNWQIEAVFLLLGGIMLSFCMGGALIGILHHAGVAAFQSDLSLGPTLLATLSFHGVALILLFFFLKYHQIGWNEILGLKSYGLVPALLLALLVLVIMLPVTLGLQALSTYVLTRLHFPADTQEAVDLLLNAPSLAMRIYMIIFAVVVAPFAEEFIFRGVMFPFIKQLGYPKLAWLVPSFIFALVHGNLPILVPLFVLALALTWLYEKTGRLITNILVHSLFNAINVILLFVVKS